jgi:hypothetical protein
MTVGIQRTMKLWTKPVDRFMLSLSFIGLIMATIGLRISSHPLDACLILGGAFFSVSAWLYFVVGGRRSTP